MDAYGRYPHEEVIPVKGRIDKKSSKYPNDGENQDQTQTKAIGDEDQSAMIGICDGGYGG